MIYLDNASTTRPLPEAVNEFNLSLAENGYNMGAKYKGANLLHKKYEMLKSRLKDKLGATSGEIVVGASATLLNNLVISSINPKNKGIVAIFAGEHASVISPAKKLKDNGADVRFIPLTKSGDFDYEYFENLLKEGVRFVGCMHVSNETGQIFDIKRITKLAKEYNPNCLVFSDGVQALAKTKIDLDDLGVDFYTISAHKIGGIIGASALFVRDISKLKPFVLGGGQEFDLVSGTENYPAFSAFMVALTLDLTNFEENFAKVSKFKEELISELTAQNIEFRINGTLTSPYILNVSFYGVRGEALLYALDERGIMVANGSACSSKKRGNATLESMGLNKEEVDGAVRFSFSAQYDYDAKTIAKIIKEEIDKIKH